MACVFKRIIIVLWLSFCGYRSVVGLNEHITGFIVTAMVSLVEVLCIVSSETAWRLSSL